jgi:hypothetical protein
MGKPSAPEAPDYIKAAQTQGAANLEAARATAKLSTPNVYSPWGSQKVTYGTFDQAGYDKAMADYNQALEKYKSGGGDPNVDVAQKAEDDFKASYGKVYRGTLQPTDEEIAKVRSDALSSAGLLAKPTKEQFTTDVDTPTLTIDLPEEAKAALKSQQTVQRDLANLGVQAVGTAKSKFDQPFKYTGPDIQTSLGGYGQVQNAPNLEAYGRAGAGVSAQPIDYGPRMGQYGLAQAGPSAGQFGMQEGGVQGPQLQTSLDTGGQIERGPQMGQYGYAQGGPGGPQLQGRLDTSQLAAMPINAGMTAQNAIMSRLQPQLQAQRAQLETQLANQGLVRGGEAYNAAMATQSLKENDLLTQAALQGLNLDMAARQQGLGEQQALGGFANQAALSQFGAGQQAAQAQNAAMQQNYAQALATAQQGNAAQQQAFQQRVQSGEFGNQAQLASFNANLQNQQARNQAAAQNFAQSQAANQAYNQAVQQNMAMGMSVAQAQNAASQQLFGQNMDIQGLYNAALSQNQQTALAQMQAQNAAQNQAFNQALQAGQFGNTAAQQALQQQLGLYNQPLNQIAALMSGTQIQMPQFQSYGGANVAPTPIGNAAAQQAAWNQGLYNADLSSYNSAMGTAGSIAAAAIL